MATLGILQIQRMFATRPMSPEQADRLQLVRHSAATFVQCLATATPDVGPQAVAKQMAIDAVRQAFAFMEHAISLEEQGGRDNTMARVKFFQGLKSKLTPGEHARLASLLGMIELVDEDREEKAAS